VADNLTMEGMDEILAKLMELGQRAGPLENQALYAGAEIVQANASQRAPRSETAGEHLADNIVISLTWIALLKVQVRLAPTATPVAPSVGTRLTVKALGAAPSTAVNQLVPVAATQSG
jgi:hypothetical protein